MTSFLPDSRPRVFVALGLMLVLGACAAPQQTPSSTTPSSGTTPTAPSPAPGSPGGPPPVAGSTTPPPQAAPAPVVDPAIARPQAQKLALEAVDQLQNGDEAGARATLDRAIALDATNDLARKLQEQIRADAQKELGPVFFRYTVQRDDTLSKLAQQYLGDRFRFYLLAKYNDITNPSRLSAGQVIKLPGKGPLPPTTPPVAETPAAPAKPEPPVAKRDDVTDMLARAADLEKSGNLEGAYAAYNDVLQRVPNNPDATKRRDTIRTGLVRTYDREATQAFQRQNLDLAIEKWDRVLELDPANRKARLERDRAADLKKRMQAKFGSKEAAK
jgi:tetratricopeptide (TPR) repeat protein